jgi:hypothetical protein
VSYNDGLNEEVRRKMYSMFSNGSDVKEISAKLKLPYITVYYYLRKKGLIVPKRAYIKVDNYQFDYKAYLAALLERCRKLHGMSPEEFAAYSKTVEGENAIIRCSVDFTPSIYLSIINRK